MNVVQSLPIKFLSISPDEARVTKRGFCCDSNEARDRIEQIGESFLCGYHVALSHSLGRRDDADLVSRLNACTGFSDRGFVFEGAGMALQLLDGLLPVRHKRLEIFLEGAANWYVHTVYVGAGWAIARLPWLKWNLDSTLKSMDPLFRWLAIDGFGFHEGYFNWRVSVNAQRVPRALKGYSPNAFDQGLGRSLWFVSGASPRRIASIIAGFPAARRPDLWSGVGLASAYAGGVPPSEIEELATLSRDYWCEVAQGVAFAAKARQHAGIPTSHTNMVCEILCRISAAEAASITDASLEGVPRDGSGVAYELWRSNIRRAFQTSGAAARRIAREVSA